MSQPKFSVGEVVILQSKEKPNLNGEYNVSLCVGKGGVYQCKSTGYACIRAHVGFGYRLDGFLELDSYGRERLICESAIRKRHQPGEYTWEGLKTILTMPVSREELARLGGIDG